MIPVADSSATQSSIDIVFGIVHARTAVVFLSLTLKFSIMNRSCLSQELWRMDERIPQNAEHAQQDCVKGTWTHMQVNVTRHLERYYK